jgi:hypothetical protein
LDIPAGLYQTISEFTQKAGAVYLDENQRKLAIHPFLESILGLLLVSVTADTGTGLDDV